LEAHHRYQQANTPMTAEPTPRVLDVQEFVDARPLSRVQKQLLLLCFAVVAVDGFDTAIIGFIAPAIRAEWGVAIARLGPLFAAGLFGLMLGAFAVGPLADRHGRKTMLVASMVVFGGASLASALSQGVQSLTWLRFLTGVGLGGAMPTTITLASEYCPRDRRSSLVTLMFCGFTLGSALGGIIAARVLPLYGWRALLIGGGVAPLLLAPLLAWALPESVRYLVMTGATPARIAGVLRRISPDADLRGVVFAGVPASPASPVRQLLGDGLLAGTLLLWLSFFMSLLVVYLLTNWMPTLIQQASGATLGGAAFMAAMFQVGGTIGAIAIGRLMDRLEPHAVLCGAYFGGAASVIAISLSAATPAVMTMAVFAAGFCISGGQVGANALSAAFYPTACRATGVSWANGIGRSGSIVGSLLGGILLGSGWPATTVYALVAVPAAISAVALGALGIVRVRSQGPGLRQTAGSV
jgi:AAHS family 4-hydroxybenzoate transporter-like MFS transporter